MFTFEREHNHNGEKQGDEGYGAYPGNKFCMVPILVFYPDQYKPGKKTCYKGYSQIDKHTPGNLPHGNIFYHVGSLYPEPAWENGNKHPGVNCEEQYLENGIECHQSGSVFGISSGQFVPDDHHRDTTGEPDQYQAIHIVGIILQEYYRQKEHKHRTNKPVLNKAQSQYLIIFKYAG